MERKKIPNINLDVCKISADVLRLVPPDIMKKYTFLPFDYSDDRLSIAVSTPKDTAVLDDIEVITGYKIEPFYAARDAIWARIKQLLPDLYVQAEAKELEISEPSANGRPQEKTPGIYLADEPSISKTVDQILKLAVQRGASDIHLEPQENGLFVRFRVDGILTTLHKYSKLIQPALTARVKVLANMDITERRLPQDNQFSFHVNHKNIDLRVSTLPGKYGEKIVLRVLDKSSFSLDLGGLGMNPDIQTAFENLIQKPQGLILVTGPTGSGKTTTLYSVLNRLNSPEKNVITLEDPIEYELLAGKAAGIGVTQVHINSKIGMTFAAGLRASLRQDPDVIMVGEVRDKETAEIAMKSSLTGHLVFSTLHTNDAFGTLLRLKDMGVEPYLIASTVMGIMAQRLVRVLCQHCKESYRPPARALKLLFPKQLPTLEDGMLYRAKGCEKCQGLGYQGRKGIYELLLMNENLASAIKEGSQSQEARDIGRSATLETLRESGLDLVAKGLTTVEEVFRITVE